MSTPRNPAFAGLAGPAPTTIAGFKARVDPHGSRTDLVDLSVGDPRVEVGETTRATLAEGVPAVSAYPLASGTAEVRDAIAAWVRRRFGVAVDAGTEVVPTHGSKEAVAAFTQLVTAPAATGDGARSTVVVTTPGYPTPEHAARLLGADVVTLGLGPEGGFLPDLDAVPPAVWSRVALLWLNYPNNPTAAVAPLDLYERAAELARRHGFVVASDEAYVDVYGSTPPPSALQVSDRSHVVVFTSLSKRSGLTAFRCGAVVGPAELLADLKRLRAMLGLAPQVFTQHLAARSWDDDGGAASLRVSLMARTRILVDAARGAGAETYGGDASPFVWMRVPDDETELSLCTRLADAGVVVTPGSFFGAAGAGFVRMAAMAPAGDCERAAAVLRAVL
ncbi:MAG: aminotransferase class I/II-fold pyridoxal phosphate-dependent enzyme [Acidimicrobiia bacterium]|nr:aminotransferase class I/II-fold pyridoxal phosphate-dependent enzyme [Acidimicrobiia bacterium]